MRLDELLVERQLFASRSRARDSIVRGCVQVEGEVISKPGHKVEVTATIKVQDPAKNLVSRAGLKLRKALEHFAISVAGKTCLDIGVSTGGFTQILLENGVAHIIAIDVGHGQLHPSLARDKRITLHEGLNARHLQRHHLGGHKPTVLVCDVSFISLKLALPPALALMEAGSQAILLVKPQFEAGRGALNGQGIVRDKQQATTTAQAIATWLDTSTDWHVKGLIESPIIGGDGNQEFLLYAIKNVP